MLYEILITEHSKMLKNLDAMLDKAVAYAELKKFDVAILLNGRLAPDQFNFIRQVQIACDGAKFSAARLAGKVAPANPDTETTVAELKARIQTVVDYLASYKADDFTEADSRKISLQWWQGKHMTGRDFAIQYAIPNFAFHVTTAYSILRHNGVDVGKADYLGKLPLHE